jgi:hypothetical protein
MERNGESARRTTHAVACTSLPWAMSGTCNQAGIRSHARHTRKASQTVSPDWNASGARRKRGQPAARAASTHMNEGQTRCEPRKGTVAEVKAGIGRRDAPITCVVSCWRSPRNPFKIVRAAQDSRQALRPRLKSKDFVVEIGNFSRRRPEAISSAPKGASPPDGGGWTPVNDR